MKDKSKTSKKTSLPEEKKSKTPWRFNMEVKDLVNPITISRTRIYTVVALLAVVSFAGYYVWENFLRTPSGLELVNEMVTAAGGMEAWNNINTGQFTRTRNLYDESGTNLSQKVETFYFEKSDAGAKLMVQSMDKEGNEVWVGQDDEGFWATRAKLPADPKLTARELGMMCDSKWCNPTCASEMAFYKFSMPFKLKDNGVRPEVRDGSVFAILDWNPIEFLDLKLDPLVLDVSYKPTVGKDKWRFIVDPKDKLIHKVEYYNKSDFGEIRPEEIYWSDHKNVNGLNVSHRWTRYWANGQVMEEYIFSEMNFKSDKAEELFNRPEGLDWTFTQ